MARHRCPFGAIDGDEIGRAVETAAVGLDAELIEPTARHDDMMPIRLAGGPSDPVDQRQQSVDVRASRWPAGLNESWPIGMPRIAAISSVTFGGRRDAARAAWALAQLDLEQPHRRMGGDPCQLLFTQIALRVARIVLAVPRLNHQVGTAFER